MENMYWGTKYDPPSYNNNKRDTLVILVCWKKLANALFGQKNQHFAIFLKLIREMLLFCNSIIRKSRFIEELDCVIVELSSTLFHIGVADVAFSN